MFLALGIVIGIIWGLFAKGRISHLVEPGLKLLLLPIGSFLLQFADEMLFKYAHISWQHPTITVISYAMMIFFFVANRFSKAGVILAGSGSLLNFIVMLANGFLMPVAPIELVLKSAPRVDYMVATNGANLYFLGDIIKLPIPVVGGLLSIGDILIFAGIIFFIKDAMMQINTNQENHVNL